MKYAYIYQLKKLLPKTGWIETDIIYKILKAEQKQTSSKTRNPSPSPCIDFSYTKNIKPLNSDSF